MSSQRGRLKQIALTIPLERGSIAMILLVSAIFVLVTQREQRLLFPEPRVSILSIT
jgi:hypothetical protein